MRNVIIAAMILSACGPVDAPPDMLRDAYGEVTPAPDAQYVEEEYYPPPPRPALPPRRVDPTEPTPWGELLPRPEPEPPPCLVCGGVNVLD